MNKRIKKKRAKEKERMEALRNFYASLEKAQATYAELKKAVYEAMQTAMALKFKKGEEDAKD